MVYEKNFCLRILLENFTLTLTFIGKFLLQFFKEIVNDFIVE